MNTLAHWFTLLKLYLSFDVLLVVQTLWYKVAQIFVRTSHFHVSIIHYYRCYWFYCKRVLLEQRGKISNSLNFSPNLHKNVRNLKETHPSEKQLVYFELFNAVFIYCIYSYTDYCILVYVLILNSSCYVHNNCISWYSCPLCKHGNFTVEHSC